MQAADDVELRDCFAPPFAGAMPNLFERHRISARVPGLFAERAEPAARHANVSRGDMAVDVEVRYIPVQPLAHDVGQVPETENIRRPVKSEAIFVTEPAAGFYFVENAAKLRIFDQRVHRLKRRAGEKECRLPKTERIARSRNHSW